MNKRLTVMLASALLAGGLMLPACGSSPEASAPETAQPTEAEQTTKEPEPDPQEQVLGDWTLAGLKSNDVTILGDMGSMLGTEGGMALSFKEGGSGTISLADESTDLTWELKDNKVTIKVEQDKASEDEGEDEDEDEDEDESIPQSMSGTLKDDQITFDVEEMSGSLVFTRDGKMEGFSPISIKDATAITKQDELVGTWKLAGMNMLGMTAYGTAEDLASLAGQDFDATIELKADGTGTLAGDTISWQIGEDGATIGEGGMQLSLTKVDDSHILLDMSGLIGQDMALLLTK